MNVAHEIQNYAWAKDKDGRPTDKPEHDFSHSMDSLRYVVEPLLTGVSSVWARKMF